MVEVFKGRNQDRQEFKVLGRRDIPGRLSYAIATGAAMYAGDRVLPDMLYGKVLRSPYGRARIRTMDTSKAEALPGVKAVITWEDKELRAMPLMYDKVFPINGGRPVLSNEADREGDSVGVVVAAESEEICDEALKLIQTEWEVLPHVLDPKAAIKPDAPILQPILSPKTNVFKEENWEDGDVEAGFREAGHIIEYNLFLPLRNQFHPNPTTVVAWWEQDKGGSEGKTLFMEGDPGNRFTYGTQDVVRAVFNLTEDKLHCLTEYSGGRYCDFDCRREALLTPLLAKRTGRPVRMEHSRRDEFDVGSAQCYSHVKIGFNDDCMLIAAHGQTVNGEGTTGSSVRFMDMTSFRTTKCPNIKSESKLVFTSTPRVRGDMGTYYTFQILTTALWRIADELGMDPTEVALKNCHTPEPSLKECIKRGKAAIGWDEKWHLAGTRKLPNGKMHGLGFRYHNAWFHGVFNYLVSLAIKPDGKVYMPHRGPWIGTFDQDACCMVIAEELGARIEDVIPQIDPILPFWIGVGGSDAGATATWVAKEAALDLKASLLKKAAEALQVATEELDTKDSHVYLKADPKKSFGFGDFGLLATFYQGKCPPYDQSMKTLTTMNALFCEVEVDTETGDVEVTKWVGVIDAGKAIRLSSCEGQVEHALIATSGAGKTEEYIWDKKTGVMLNASALEYKLPTILDVPRIDPIIVETRTAGGCYGATGISHQIMNREIINCAVQNAIGKWIDDVPITPDKILKALGKI